MRFIKNKQGIALVTSLMITLISLVIVMALLLMITQSIQTSGQLKRYKTALDASYGGTELVVKDIFPLLLQNYDNSNIATDVASRFSAVSLSVDAATSCIQSKLVLSSKDWPSGCSNTSNAKSAPDLTFNLAAVSGGNFRVYTKIVETIKGNTDQSGLQLEGSGVAESSTLLKPKHQPYLYRLEIQGERANNPTAQANLEVLYAY